MQRSERPSSPSVLHVAVTYRRAGTEQIVLDLAKRSIADGTNIAIVIPPSPLLDTMAADARHMGADVFRIGPLFESGRPRIRNARSLYGVMRSMQPWIVHFHFPWAPTCAESIIAARIARAPVLIRTEHNPIVSALTCKQRWMLKCVDPMVNQFVCVSSGSLQTHVVNGGRDPSRCRLILNGIEVSTRTGEDSVTDRARVRSSLGLPPEAPVCVMVGALEERKGVLDFVRAARVASTQHPDMRFVVVGDGGSRAAAEELATRCGLGDRTYFVGYRTDVEAILAACDIYVQPSQYEGLSIAMLEALAAGLPMVTTRVDGVHDVFPDERGVICVDVGDTTGLGEGMARLGSDATLRRELAGASVARVRETFTADRMYESYRDLYEELTQQSFGAAGLRR
jgi:glycosyltransferase involved in cell wall biosynthesis